MECEKALKIFTKFAFKYEDTSKILRDIKRYAVHSEGCEKDEYGTCSCGLQHQLNRLHKIDTVKNWHKDMHI